MSISCLFVPKAIASSRLQIELVDDLLVTCLQCHMKPGNLGKLVMTNYLISVLNKQAYVSGLQKAETRLYIAHLCQNFPLRNTRITTKSTTSDSSYNVLSRVRTQCVFSLSLAILVPLNGYDGSMYM